MDIQFSILSTEEVANAVGHTGERYEGEIKRLKKLTERLDAEKQHYRCLYERQLEVIIIKKWLETRLWRKMFNDLTF